MTVDEMHELFERLNDELLRFVFAAETGYFGPSATVESR